MQSRAVVTPQHDSIPAKMISLNKYSTCKSVLELWVKPKDFSVSVYPKFLCGVEWENFPEAELSQILRGGVGDNSRIQ